MFVINTDDQIKKSYVLSHYKLSRKFFDSTIEHCIIILSKPTE